MRPVQRITNEYLVHVEFVGIKELGLPEALTAKVFERMRTERERLVKKYLAEGTSEAIKEKPDATKIHTLKKP